MVKKKAPIKSRKPLVGEALYEKLAGDAFTSITLNESRLIRENWQIVNAHEEAMLHAITSGQHESQTVEESTILIARTKLADVYHRSGLEGDLIAGFRRANQFVERATKTINKINNIKTDIGQGVH